MLIKHGGHLIAAEAAPSQRALVSPLWWTLCLIRRGSCLPAFAMLAGSSTMQRHARHAHPSRADEAALSLWAPTSRADAGYVRRWAFA